MRKSSTFIGYLYRLLSSMASAAVIFVILVVALEKPVLAAYHDVRIFASPTSATLTARSIARVSCLAEAPFEVPYISFWWQLPNGPFTWLSDEDPGVSIRLVGKPGNRTVTLDLWIGREFYEIMPAGPNKYLCRATTDNDQAAFANFTINKV